MTKVDRRIIKTREAIHKAFMALLMEKRFEQITINDIAERADINRGTLYLHYTDKYDLLTHLVDKHFDTLKLSSLQDVFQYFEQNYAFFSMMVEKWGAQCFRERLLQAVIGDKEFLIADIKGESQIHTELCQQFVSAAFVGAVEWWLKEKMPLTPEQMASHVEELLQRSLKQ